jgi:hypothetical protein
MGYELLAQSRSPALRIDVPVCLLIVAEILGNLSAGRWPLQYSGSGQLIGAENEASSYLRRCMDGYRGFFTICNLSCQRLTFPLEIDVLRQ